MWMRKSMMKFQFGTCSKVKATRGNVHDCLGMMFGYKDEKVEINMVEHVKNMLQEFPIKFKEIIVNMTPAGVDSFSKDLSEKLSKEMKRVFLQTVAQRISCAQESKT